MPIIVGVQVCTAGNTSVGILHVVKSVIVGFPNLNAGSWNRVTLGVGYSPRDPGGLTRGTAGDIASDGDFGGVFGEERPEHSSFGGIFIGSVGDIDALQRQTQHVGEQD